MSLSESPLFEGCDPRAAKAAEQVATIASYRVGEVVLRIGTPAKHVFVLLKGAVRVSIPGAEGVQITVKLFCAPAVFGEMEALTHTPYIETVDVIQAATLARFDAKNFDALLQKHPAMARNLLVDVCHRFRTSAVNQAFIAFEAVESQLARLFSAYIKRFGVAVQGGVQVGLRNLSQNDLANGIGATTRSVQRVLAKWKELGWVVREGQGWLISDPKELQALMGDDAPALDHVFFNTPV